MSAARWRRALSVLPEPKVANFALLLSVRQTENRINNLKMPVMLGGLSDS